MGKKKQPYIPIYTGDYLKDTRSLSLEAKGAWMDLIIFIWVNGKAGIIEGTMEDFARMVGTSEVKFASVLQELCRKDICDVHGDQHKIFKIVCRRLAKEAAISEVRSEVGSIGGKASRNTRTKKLYDSPGFLYLVKDDDKQGEFKLGISKDPDKRLSGIRRTYKRTNVSIVFKWPVPDMGNYEDSILEYYNDVRDGEWIYMDVNPDQLKMEISSLIQNQNNSKIKPKQQQKSDIDNEYDIDNEIELKKEPVSISEDQTLEIVPQGTFIEQKLSEALDEIYIDQQRSKWEHINFDFELTTFQEKVRGSPTEYINRDSDGIRLAFQYQLRNAKSKQPEKKIKKELTLEELKSTRRNGHV